MKRTVKHGTAFSDKDARIISKFLRQQFPDGFIEAKEVLEYARPRNSPIHQYFCWDDSRAAELYRLQQARKLIQCLVVEIDGIEVREYTTPVTVSISENNKYVEVNKARNTPSLWNQVLAKAIQDANYWNHRYRHLKELTPISVAINKTTKKLKKHGVSYAEI